MRRWFPGCCASAASGHAPTKPETIFMNSRRCMAFLPREGHFRRLEEYQITALALCLWSQAANVRFGSKADIGLAPVDVRSTPKSGHSLKRQACPLCADFVAEVGGYGLLVIDHRF
jgi:hypothetical protein